MQVTFSNSRNQITANTMPEQTVGRVVSSTWFEPGDLLYRAKSEYIIDMSDGERLARYTAKLKETLVELLQPGDQFTVTV